MTTSSLSDLEFFLSLESDGQLRPAEVLVEPFSVWPLQQWVEENQKNFRVPNCFFMNPETFQRILQIPGHGLDVVVSKKDLEQGCLARLMGVDVCVTDQITNREIYASWHTPTQVGMQRWRIRYPKGEFGCLVGERPLKPETLSPLFSMVERWGHPVLELHLSESDFQELVAHDPFKQILDTPELTQLWNVRIYRSLELRPVAALSEAGEALLLFR